MADPRPFVNRMPNPTQHRAYTLGQTLLAASSAQTDTPCHTLFYKHCAAVVQNSGCLLASRHASVLCTCVISLPLSLLPSLCTHTHTHRPRYLLSGGRGHYLPGPVARRLRSSQPPPDLPGLAPEELAQLAAVGLLDQDQDQDQDAPPTPGPDAPPDAARQRQRPKPWLQPGGDGGGGEEGAPGSGGSSQDGLFGGYMDGVDGVGGGDERGEWGPQGPGGEGGWRVGSSGDLVGAQLAGLRASSRPSGRRFLRHSLDEGHGRVYVHAHRQREGGREGSMDGDMGGQRGLDVHSWGHVSSSYQGMVGHQLLRGSSVQAMLRSLPRHQAGLGEGWPQEAHGLQVASTGHLPMFEGAGMGSRARWSDAASTARSESHMPIGEQHPPHSLRQRHVMRYREDTDGDVW